MYLRAANQLSFSTASTLAGYFDATQNLILAHALATAQGGTGATAFPAIADNLGDKTAAANSLAQRDASADLFVRQIDQSIGTTNPTIGCMMVESNALDGKIARMTLANFLTQVGPQVTPDALSTASGSAPSYSIRAWAHVNAAGGLISGQNIASAGRSSLGVFFVTFTTAMTNTNFGVIACAQHVTANFIICAHEAENAVVAKTVSQVGIQIINSGGAVDAPFTVAIYQ